MSDTAAPSEELASRLDNRAWWLRVQAYVILATIILVLIAGAVAFVFANQIVNLSFQSHTAADQYAAALAAAKQIDSQLAELNKRETEIRGNDTAIRKPFEDQIRGIRAQIGDVEEKILKGCENIKHTGPRGDVNADPVLSPRPATDRLGEFFITLTTQDVYFGDRQAAQKCASELSTVMKDITPLRRRIQDVSNEEGKKITEFQVSLEPKIKPLSAQIYQLTQQQYALQPVIAETNKRATEERILGAPIGGEGTNRDRGSITTDWAQIIQSNLTRLSSLAIMFFLVAILVPQYRYSIRMAAFYEARADSIRLARGLQPITHLQDLEKAIAAMTPNIDFGKAPATPIDQLIALIKSIKG